MTPGRVALVAVAILIGAEIAVRVEDWITTATPFFSPYTSQNDLLVRDADGVHGRRHAAFGKWHLNALGLRGPAADSAKPAGTLRVFTTGASETFGVYESPDHEFPRQLEDTLNAHGPVCGGRAEVLNAAFRGMSLPTVTQDIRNRVRRFGPDVIVYYPTPSQYLEDKVPTPAAPDSLHPDVGASPWKALRLRFLDRLVDRIRTAPPAGLTVWLRERRVRAAARQHPAGWRFDSLPLDRLADYERDLRVLVGTVRSVGARPVLGTHANYFQGPANRRPDWESAWELVYPRAPLATLIAFDSAARLVTLRVGQDSGVAVVDVASLLRGGGTRIFGDFAHFTDVGAGEVAAQVAAAVTRACAESAGR